MQQDPNLFLSLGRVVKDEYGRPIGEVASFAVKPHGVVDAVYIRHSDGRFIKYPAGTIKVDGSEVIFLSKVKCDTAVFCDQIPLIWRKDQALKELLEKKKISPEVYEDLHRSFEGALNQLKSEAQKKISPEVYEDLHRSFEGALNQLKSEAQALLERINKEIEKCDQEIMELNYALVHLEVEHEIGEVDDQSYQTAFTTIQDCLKKVNLEKTDLENMKNKLSNILLGESPLKNVTEEHVKEAPTPPSPSLPEPPVIVYVREAGE
ncbi:MAG: CdvA-like protein [Candidatus Bathyarchaeia archaeon]